MDNYNSFDDFEKWDTLTEPTPVDNATNDSLDALNDVSEVKSRKTKKCRSPILTIQLTIALILLLIIFLAKLFAVDLYRSFISWYDSEISTSMYLSGDFSKLDYSEFFLIATDDEV